MIEIKLSQGAKPGHGGILPGAKVTRGNRATRGVPMGEDCISPARHRAFSTPLELMHFIAELRRLSRASRSGFKLCVGQPWEFMGMVKAMRETGIHPDFIVVDGAEGGTGASPLEFADHLGMPMREGLLFVHNTLVGAGLRSKIKIGAAGKIVSGFDIAAAMALGADWTNAGARLHVRAGLHPVAHLPYQQLPDGRGDPGPDAPARAGRPGQGGAGL